MSDMSDIHDAGDRGNSAIKAESLPKSFGKKQALTNLTFSLKTSGITGLVGRNGAGKTTLLKLAAGLISKSSGTLEVWNENPMDNLDVLTRLVYSHPQLSYNQLLRLDDILGDYHTMFPGFDSAFARKLLDYFDLGSRRRYSQLSQGMKATFNFVAGLATRAPLTMFDEPTLGMDVTTRKAVYEILLREYSEHPRAIIISSHLMSELEGVLTDVLLIDAGNLILHDSIENLRQSAYLLEGEEAALDAYCRGRNVIYRKQGETGSRAVIHEPYTEESVQHARSQGLKLLAVRPEDLCIYLTRKDKEGELECLW